MNRPLAGADTSPAMNANASREYLRNAILTASPEQLQLMLYDGAIRFAREGRQALEEGAFERAFERLVRAQRIVNELRNGLRPDVDRTLCERMEALYLFIYRRLVEGCVEKDVGRIDEALELLEYQRETWVLLLEKLREERAGSVSSAEPGRPQRTPPRPAEAQATPGSLLSTQG